MGGFRESIIHQAINHALAIDFFEAEVARP